MSRSKRPVLNEKHLKALGLIKQGDMTLGEVAEACGWKEDYLYDLAEGNTAKAGEVASFLRPSIERSMQSVMRK